MNRGVDSYDGLTVTLEADIAAGAPVNADGTVNAIAYAAWILKGESDDD